MQLKHLHFKKNKFEFRELVTKEELQLAYRFRYDICVKQLHWIKGDPVHQVERDEYDEYSYHFGCFLEGKMVGYIRMTPEIAPVVIMSRKYFPRLWHNDPDYPKDRSADISRLIIAREQRHNRKQLKLILMGLYRLTYARARLVRPSIRYWYFITSPVMARALHWQFGFSVKKHGHGVTSDGKLTYVASLDLEKGWRRLLLLAPLRLRYFERAKKLERDHIPL